MDEVFLRQFLKYRPDDQVMAHVFYKRLERARTDDACPEWVFLCQEGLLKLWHKQVAWDVTKGTSCLQETWASILLK